MKIKQTILSLLMLLTLVPGALAQNSEKAKRYLDEVSAKVKSYDNIVMEFKYTLSNSRENIKQETRGTATLQGDKYWLELMGASRLFDGKKIYTVAPEDEEVTISDLSNQDEGEITPSKMLRFYEQGYSYKWDIEQNVKGRKIQYIHLKPIKETDIKEILLGIDTETKHIYKLIQKQHNGTDVTITVTSFKYDQPLPKAYFTFDESKYADYYINRLD